MRVSQWTGGRLCISVMILCTNYIIYYLFIHKYSGVLCDPERGVGPTWLRTSLRHWFGIIISKSREEYLPGFLPAI